MKKNYVVIDLYESYFFECVVGGSKTFTVDVLLIVKQTIFVPHFTEPFCADIVVIG